MAFFLIREVCFRSIALLSPLEPLAPVLVAILALAFALALMRVAPIRLLLLLLLRAIGRSRYTDNWGIVAKAA